MSLDHGPRFPCMPFGQAAQLHESEPYNLDGWLSKAGIQNFSKPHL